MKWRLGAVTIRNLAGERYIWFLNKPATTRINIEEDGNVKVGLTFESNAVAYGKQVGFLVDDVRLLEEYADDVLPINDRLRWLCMSLRDVRALAKRTYS